MERWILFDIPLPEQLCTAPHLSPLKLIHKCYITYSQSARKMRLSFSLSPSLVLLLFFLFLLTESANTQDDSPKSFNYSNRET